MTPEFSSLVNPTMHYVLDLVSRIQRQATGIDLRQERDHIRGELEAAAATADGHDSPVSGEEFRLAKQGLIYWIDEVMTIADPAWQTMTLEWHYFQSLDRAWKFYVDDGSNDLGNSSNCARTIFVAHLTSSYRLVLIQFASGVLAFEGFCTTYNFHQLFCNRGLTGPIELKR